MLVDGAIEGERGAHGHFDSALVEDRKSAGEPEAHGADVGVRRIAEARGAATEDFCFREELDVDLEADDGLIFRHKETRIIALPRRASGGVEAVTGVSA